MGENWTHGGRPRIAEGPSHCQDQDSKQGRNREEIPRLSFLLISHLPGGSHWPNPSRPQMMQPKGVSHPSTQQDGGGGDKCVHVCKWSATSIALQLDFES